MCWEIALLTSHMTSTEEDNDTCTRNHTQSTSWHFDGSPSCLGGSSHGWVPVNTHSTPVPTSEGRLWVAQQHYPTPQFRQHGCVRQHRLFGIVSFLNCLICHFRFLVSWIGSTFVCTFLFFCFRQRVSFLVVLIVAVCCVCRTLCVVFLSGLCFEFVAFL